MGCVCSGMANSFSNHQVSALVQVHRDDSSRGYYCLRSLADPLVVGWRITRSITSTLRGIAPSALDIMPSRAPACRRARPG